MQRIWLVGTSGSGKSTLALAICERTGMPWIELDAIYHQSNWTPLAKPAFRAAVRKTIAHHAWVVDGNYIGTAGDLILARADTVVLLDLPRYMVMRQVVWRTVRRMLTREELWNGNRERLRDLFTLDKKRSIIVWAWATHGKTRRRVEIIRTEPKYQGLRFIQLQSRKQVNQFLASLTPTPDRH